VSPAAEDVVIGAAYRALMRHYHPDTNPDPTAQARAREITAAYAILRDPVKRAEYDAQRADGDLWSQDDDDDRPPRRPPAMRAVGIASAVLALGLVVAVWTLAEKDPSTPPTGHSQPAREETPKGAANPAYPVVQLEPESERLARLREEAEILSPVAPPADETPAPHPIVAPAKAQPATAAPVRAPVAAPRLAATRRVAAVQVLARPAPPQSAPNGKAVSAAAPPKSKQLTALDTMAAGFFTQSMAHATDAKKELLLSARNRSMAKRKACGSDACAAATYVVQIRETSAIMEGRTGPPK
jgi:curved DNA-binding protein CbpA